MEKKPTKQEKTLTTHQGFLDRKKTVLRSGESLDLRLKATKSCAILTVLPSVPVTCWHQRLAAPCSFGEKLRCSQFF